MHRSARFWAGVVAINIAASMLANVAFRDAGWHGLLQFLHASALTSLFSFCCSSLCIIGLPHLVPLARRWLPFPLDWAAIVVVLIGFASAGMLIALGTLAAVGYIRSADAFVRWYAAALKIAIRRVRHPRELMAYLGLVPSEHSSGPSVRRGAVTKAGNPHVRRLLAEAAWAYQGIPRIGRQHAYRQEALPKVVCDIAWRAQLRLTGRFRRLVARGKAKPKVATAIARELVGFVWRSRARWRQRSNRGTRTRQRRSSVFPAAQWPGGEPSRALRASASAEMSVPRVRQLRDA